MRTITNLIAWLRGMTWIRNNTTYCDLATTKIDSVVEDYVRDFKVMQDSSAVDRMNMRREVEVEAGNFVYYVVDEGTNSRKMHEGAPIVYTMRGITEIDCEGYDEVISVAAYNRLYGRFMP